MHCCKRCTGACLRPGNAMPGIAKRIGNLSGVCCRRNRERSMPTIQNGLVRCVVGKSDYMDWLGIQKKKGSPCIITCMGKMGGKHQESNLWDLTRSKKKHTSYSLTPSNSHSLTTEIHPSFPGWNPSSNPKLFCTSKGNWPSLPNTQGVDLPFVTFVAARTPQATGIGLWKLRPSAKSNCKWKYFGAEVMPLPTHGGRLVA